MESHALFVHASWFGGGVGEGRKEDWVNLVLIALKTRRRRIETTVDAAAAAGL